MTDEEFQQMDIFGINELSIDDRKEVVRTQLHGLLTSYADEADVFTEIIQNALDSLILAIEREKFVGSETVPTIRIVIGRNPDSHHYLFVSDNGVGMTPEVAQKLTVPGFTADKRRGKTLGYKGVGASYFFATSECISLRTVSDDNAKTEYTVRDAYNWIQNVGEPEPRVEETFWCPEAVNNLVDDQPGTAVCVQFHEGMKPHNLNNLVIVSEGAEAELRNWIAFLAVKTAIGATVDRSDLGVRVELFLDNGEGLTHQTWSLGSYDSHAYKVGYPFPQLVFGEGSTKSTNDIDNTPDHQRHQHTRRYHAVRHRWDGPELIDSMTNLSESEKAALQDSLKWCEGYLAYSTDVIDEVNKRLGGRSRLLRHGIRLSCDGIPQGRVVDLSLTSSQGLDRQTHIVLGFEGLELDQGRKISADERIAGAITKIGNRVVSVLKEYRWAMKKKDRPDISTDLAEWRQKVDERAQGALVQELYSKIGKPPAFRVDPDNESEVIALFVALIEQELLAGYRVQAISGYATYDCLVDVDVTSASTTRHDDPLSVRNTDEDDGGESRVLEFKYSYDALMDDFEAKKKNPSEIDLCVCWVVPTLNVSRGRLDPTYGKWKDGRSVYGGTYVWTDDNQTSRFPIIALKNLLSEFLAAKEAAAQEQGIGHATLAQFEKLDTDAQV